MSLEGLGNGELIRLYVEKRDDSAFEEIYRRYVNLVYSVCLRVLRNESDAQDVVTACFMAFVKRAPRLGGNDNLGSWFYWCAFNAARNARLIRQRREIREKEAYDMESMEKETGRAKIDSILPAIEEQIARLPSAQRDVLVMQYYEGLTRPEIARRLGRPEGTIGTWLNRGLETVRQGLGVSGSAMSLDDLADGLGHTALLVPAPAALYASVLSVISGGAPSATAELLAGQLEKTLLISKLKTLVAVASTVILVAGGGILTMSGRQEPVAPAAAEGKSAKPANTAAYDPTLSPDFKGPEVVSGPDEPAIPGGGFKMEKYAFSQMNGNFIDGSRESCMAHNYCESVWWMDDNLVFFGDNILNVIMALDGDRLYRFAGSGVRGDKDGPAECAEFSFGVYVSPHPGLARLENGDFILTDSMNGKIKKIFKKPDGRWWVQTIAGGGKRKLKTGEIAENPADVDFWGGGPSLLQLRGPKRDHIYAATGAQNWRCTYLMYPDGKVKCLSEGGNKDLPLDIPGDASKGYYYTWKGGNWASTCWKVSRADGSEVKVVGYTDPEIKEKEKTGWKRPWDGPVEDCCIWTSGGPLRPDGRAMYVIGGDQLYLRRVMNGRIMSLETHTGKWVESRDKLLNPNSIGCVSISRLTWDGWAYMTYAYGGQGMYRARVYEPLKKPEGK